MQAEQPLSLDALTPETADPMARRRLEAAAEKFGMIPNMYTRMANAPGLLDTYIHGYDLFREHSGFTPAEQEIVFLAVSRSNGCSYCMAAHSFIADNMSDVPKPVTDAIRDGRAIDDARLSALYSFTTSMVEKRGLPSRGDMEAFLAAGFQEQQILQIALAIAVKTLSNYSNHLFRTPVDAAFAGRAWSDPRCGE
ncbi:MAG: carboxymuconolactone decarboxylase family protein [Thiohalocapsa sp.]|nr:carboxymuconolactone decarboxylase family protein [Thiohalocapsa sp.]